MAHAILLGGLVLFLAALLAVVHLMREHEAVLAHAGAALAFVGVIGSAAIVGTDGIAISQMSESASTGEMAALLDRIKDSRGLRAIGGGSGLSFLLGMLFLAIGLWRSKAASRWFAGGVAAAAITFFIAQVSDDQRIFRLAFALYAVAFVPLGVRTLTQSDDEWATPRTT